MRVETFSIPDASKICTLQIVHAQEDLTQLGQPSLLYQAEDAFPSQQTSPTAIVMYALTLALLLIAAVLTLRK